MQHSARRRGSGDIMLGGGGELVPICACVLCVVCVCNILSE